MAFEPLRPWVSGRIAMPIHVFRRSVPFLGSSDGMLFYKKGVVFFYLVKKDMLVFCDKKLTTCNTTDSGAQRAVEVPTDVVINY